MPSKELSAVAIQRHTPLYLTNVLCEHAHGNPVLFKSLGLPSGEWRGSFYPLTTQEAIFVGDDSESFGDATLLFGYSVLLEGQKWVAPSVEFHYRTSQNPAAPTCARVEAKARAFLAPSKPACSGSAAACGSTWRTASPTTPSSSWSPWSPP